MITEDKELLMKDLCARLPYGVKFLRESWNYEMDQEQSVIEVLEDIDKDGYINNTKVYTIDEVKPFLRPMSSMTIEEINHYHDLCIWSEAGYYEFGEFGDLGDAIKYYDTWESIDYLNSIHVDYRGLIPMGLALEAPKDMYNINLGIGYE